MATRMIFVLVTGVSFFAFAHHGTHPGEALPEAEKIKSINESYVHDVKPIFEKKCADCHSDHPVFPGYYKWPFAKQLIDHDIADAREHLDLSHDFPFGGHGSVQDNFKAIKEELEEGDMPPWRYTLFHSDSKITPADIQAVNHWIDDSERLLK